MNETKKNWLSVLTVFFAILLLVPTVATADDDDGGRKAIPNRLTVCE